MKIVDARGLSCPEPIMLAMEAVQAGGEFEVLVTEPHQKTNVEKFLTSKKKTFESKENNDGFSIIVKA